MKRCSRCHIEKRIEEFNKNRTSKDGVECYCKECRKKYRNEPNRKEKEKERAKCPENRARHREHCKKYESKPETKAKRREYEKRPDRIEDHRKRGRKYCQRPEVKERLKRKRKEESFLIEERKRERKYRKTKKGKIVRSRINHRRRVQTDETECTLTLDQWEKILVLQENKCVICGKKFTVKNPATKDHIIPLIEEGGLTFENIQATHKKCNSKKGRIIDKSNIVSWVSRPDLCVTTEFLAN